MRIFLPALLLLAACNRSKPTPPSPSAPEAKAEEPKPVEIPAEWNPSGDLEKEMSLSNGPVRATFRLVKRPLDDWRKVPRTFSSDTDSAGVEEKRVTVDRRDAWRVQYRYRELGRGATHPFDRRAVEVFVGKDATSSFEIVFQFADKDSDAAIPKIDAFLAAVKIRD